MSLVSVQLRSVGPSDQHAAAGFPTVGASTFPCNKVFGLYLLKTTSFLVNQIANKVMLLLLIIMSYTFCVQFFTKLKKRLLISVGGVKPKKLCIARHKNLT
jgi:hypothetical protein